MFLNEFDLLKLRLKELNPYVDKFVICESTLTHQGQPKECFLEQRLSEFSEYSDKIIYHKVSKGTDPSQRISIIEALQHCAEDDIILLSDLDEIPNLEKFDFQKYLDEQKDEILGFHGPLYYYYLNVEYPGEAYGTTITTYKTAKLMGLEALRHARTKNKIPNASWHFSYLGGVDQIVYKLESFFHREFNTPSFKDKNRLAICLQNNLDPFNRGDQLKLVKIDDSFPKTIVNNIEEYKHLIKEEFGFNSWGNNA